MYAAKWRRCDGESLAAENGGGWRWTGGSRRFSAFVA
jgi:hypothetical protein